MEADENILESLGGPVVGYPPPPTEPVAEPSVPVVDTRVRVSITPDAARNNFPKIVCSHPLPLTKAVWNFLETKLQAKVKKLYRWGWSDLDDTIFETKAFITYETWANAIAQCIIHQQAQQNGASVEVPFTGSAYLAFGDVLYKLNPVGLAPQTKALAVTRKRVIEKVQHEAKRLKENAQQASEALINSANRVRAGADMYKIETERQAKNLPPSWILNSGYPIKWSKHKQLFEVELTVKIILEAIDLTMGNGTYTWLANLGFAPKIWHLWVPFHNNGTYTATSIHTNGIESKLPHIKSESSCMELASAPKTLCCVEHLAELKWAIERCMSRVQLDSLYGGFDNWDLFKESIPNELFKALKGETFPYYSGRQAAEKLALTETRGGASFITHTQEERQTWDEDTAVDETPEQPVNPIEQAVRNLPEEVVELAEVLEQEGPSEWNTATTPI